MNSILFFLALNFLQLLAGFGVLSLFRLYLRPGLQIPLAILTGVAVFSVLPFILQLFYIPLTCVNVFASIILACIVLNLQIRKAIRNFTPAFHGFRFRIQLYEVVF